MQTHERVQKPEALPRPAEQRTPRPEQQPGHPAHRVQQTAGNRYVQATLAREASPTAAETDSSKIPSIVHDVLNSSGEPLDAATRTFMEFRLGQDFSQVRVHTDAKAAESAQAVNALAYTAGPHMVLDAGQYAPGASEGRRLIAHELVHTIQQGMARPGAVPALADQPALEQEADDIAAAVAVGAGHHPALRADAGILRDVKVPTPPPAGPYAGTQPWPPPSPPPPLDPHAVYEAKLREAVDLLRAAEFGRAEYRRESFDKGLWEKVDDPAAAPKRPAKMLRLKRWVAPSMAIIKMFGNLAAWSVDCAQFVQVAQWYAMLHAFGAREFDRKMQGLEFHLRPHGSTGVRQKRLYKRNAPNLIMMLERPAQADEPELTPVEDLFKAAPIGSRVQWTNRDPAVPKNSAWHHENTIKLGDDLFAAHGFRRRGKKNTWSASEVQQELADAAVGGNATESYVTTYVFLAQIEIYETP